MLISDRVARECMAAGTIAPAGGNMALSFLSFSSAARELERMQANKSLAYAASVVRYGDDVRLWVVAYECYCIIPPALAHKSKNSENHTKVLDTF